MRIISGSKRGLRLASVGKGDDAAHLRPTSDRVRESLFNVLTGGHYGQPITNARVLDLFAGTGALGFEALSRGAAHVSFVDDGAKAHTLLRDNADAMKAASVVKIIRRDATRLGPNPGAPFDLIFLDPPYGKSLGQKALLSAAAGNWIAEDALIICEENATQIAPAGFIAKDARRYGDTYITILQRTIS